MKQDVKTYLSHQLEGNYTFQKGIPGFESLRDFQFQLYNELFGLLTSREEPSKTFITVNPFDFFANYEFELSDDQAEELGIADPSQIVIQCIVTWHSDFKKSTANLLAPLIFNWESKTGKQIVLQGTDYTTKHPLWIENDLRSEEGDV